MSLSDFSDLTELSSDDDDISTLPSKITRTPTSKKNMKEYKISGVLRPPRTTSYTAKALYDQIIDNAIDLDPEYQREVVWPEAKQSGLIDSMLRNYYMPPIIFAVSTADDGSELRICIDGKQRLTSMQRFVDGQIPHKDSFTNEKLWYKASATNARRKILPRHLANQFANKQIVCVEYSDLSGDQEREIFQRVQLGVALTPAERMQAIVGPWPTVIREIQSQVLGEDGFQGYLDWGHARGRDFQCLASIGYLIENHPKPVVPAAPTLEKWLLKSDPVSPRLREDLIDTFRVFLILARDQKHSSSLNKPTRVSPIEFVMIGVLIYLFRDRLSLTQLSSAIEKMRKDVRDAHQDIRSNGRITNHMMSFMSKRLKISELQTDGKGDKSAAGKPTKAKKRKRLAEYDDDTEEEKEFKPPRKGTTSKAPPAASLTSKWSSNSSGSASQKKLVDFKSNPVPTTPDEWKQNRTLPPVENMPKAAVTGKAPPATVAPTTTLTRPSPTSTQSPSFQSNLVISPNPVRPSPALINVIPEVRVSPVVTSEPRIASLHRSPVILSSRVPTADRLGPIRAAKEAIRSNSGSQVQSGAPYTEHKGVGSASHLDMNGASRMRDPRGPRPSPPTVSVPPHQNSTPVPHATGQRFQINPSEVEDLLRAHGLMMQNQQLQNSQGTHQEHAVVAVSPGLHFLNGVSTYVPGSSDLQHTQGVSSNGTGLTGQGMQPVPPLQNVPKVSQAPLSLPAQPHSGLSSGTHPAPHHSLPPRPPSSVALVPSNTAPRADSIPNPPPHSAPSTGSFKDDRRYERWDYSRRGEPYEKDYRRPDFGGRRDSGDYDHHRERDGGWGQRGVGGKYKRAEKWQ